MTVLPAMLLTGLVTGLILGLTGAGGSIMAVPLLMSARGWTPVQAAPVALVAAAAAAIVGTVLAWRRGEVRYRAAALIGFAGLLAAPLGLALARQLPMHVTSFLLAAVLVAVALRLWRQTQQAAREVAAEQGMTAPAIALSEETGRFIWTPKAITLATCIGITAGVLSGLLGVGGGFVVVPALRAATALSMASAVATSLMAIAIVSSGTWLLAMTHGSAPAWADVLPFACGAGAGMLLGRALVSRLGGPRLQQGFALLLVIAACSLAARA